MKRNDNPYDKMLNTAGRAAKAAASGLLLALLLAGCSQKNPVKTQPISSMESSSEALGETSQTHLLFPGRVISFGKFRGR